jgi:hypothetical protein
MVSCDPQNPSSAPEQVLRCSIKAVGTRSRKEQTDTDLDLSLWFAERTQSLPTKYSGITRLYMSPVVQALVRARKQSYLSKFNEVSDSVAS